MQKNKINVLFICPYPVGQSPSQRFRFEQYFDLLRANGFSVEVCSFLTQSAWRILYKRGKTVQKTGGVINGIVGRLKVLASVPQFDFIFLHREATPVGPPWFEYLVAKVYRKKIIYDFDDAIWLPNTSAENTIASRLKWHSKVDAICRWSFAVSCGNQYLCDYAKQYNLHVLLNPTTIDAERLHNPMLYKGKTESDQLVIGWTGTHSTLKYITAILPVLKSLAEKFPNQIQFFVISDKKPPFQLPYLKFIPWRKETEIEDLLKFDIGLMPLTDDEWAKGKCGFKALQYMALQKPVIASAVGVNTIIIDDGKNGFLCSTAEQWESCLVRLIEDKILRATMGRSGRKKVIEHYSVLSNSTNFLSLFE